MSMWTVLKVLEGKATGVVFCLILSMVAASLMSKIGSRSLEEMENVGVDVSCKCSEISLMLRKPKLRWS